MQQSERPKNSAEETVGYSRDGIAMEGSRSDEEFQTQ